MFSHLNFTISFTYRLYGEQIFIEISVVTVGNVVFSREEKSVSLIKAKVTVGCFSASEVTAHVDPRRLPNLVIRIVNFLPFQKWTHNWSRTLFTWKRSISGAKLAAINEKQRCSVMCVSTYFSNPAQSRF